MIERVRPGIVRVKTDIGSGSGVIYSKAADGSAFVLTNHHVIEDTTSVDVVVGDSTTYESTLHGFDVARDLAVLRICCADFTTVALAQDEIPTGSEIVVIGYPLGIKGLATVSRGIVSAVRFESGIDRWVIQTDASINPGNSGGPMLSTSGEFVGIATYKVLSSRGGVAVEGVGFAVSNKTLLAQLPTLVSDTALMLPTQVPTPTPVPARFKLTINDVQVDEEGFLLFAAATVTVVPPADADGKYKASSIVELTVALFNPPGLVPFQRKTGG